MSDPGDTYPSHSDLQCRRGSTSYPVVTDEDASFLTLVYCGIGLGLFSLIKCWEDVP